MFITVFKRIRPPDSQIQSVEFSLLHPPFYSFRSILILSSSLRLCPLRSLLPSHFPTETFVHLTSHPPWLHVAARLIPLHFITVAYRGGWGVQTPPPEIPKALQTQPDCENC